MRVRNKFPTEIEAYCMNISNRLYQSGVRPGQIIKELDKKGVKGVTQGDVNYWRTKAGIENKFRYAAEVAIPDQEFETADIKSVIKKEESLREKYSYEKMFNTPKTEVENSTNNFQSESSDQNVASIDSKLPTNNTIAWYEKIILKIKKFFNNIFKI